MNYLFTPNAWEDYNFWQENDKITRKKMNYLKKFLEMALVTE